VPGGSADLRTDQGPRREDGGGARLRANLGHAFAAVVLDFDGLIVDTETPIFEAWLGAYRRRGRSLGLEEWQHTLGTHGGFDPLAHLESLVPGLARQEVLDEVKASSARGCDSQPLLPGVADLLRDARSLGLGRAVASSSSRGWVDGWLERHGIRGLLDVVVARDDVRKVKPDPELFLLAAARLGVAPRACVAFEDSPHGMRAALTAGMCCVAVPNGLTRPLARPEVDLVVDSLADMPLAAVLESLARVRARRVADLRRSSEHDGGGGGAAPDAGERH
jgi:HAD superfamily hydrolase (TIGR01509 family)